MNRTDKTLMSYGSVMRSHRPNMFKKAIERIDTLIDDIDPNVALKASVVAIEHTKGKAPQSINHQNNGKDFATTTIFVTTDTELQKAIENYNPD